MLVAYFGDESGSDTVERYTGAVKGATSGFISAVDLAETHHVVHSMDGRERVDAIVEVLEESGIRRTDTEETWSLASEFETRYAPDCRERSEWQSRLVSSTRREPSVSKGSWIR